MARILWSFLLLGFASLAVAAQGAGQPVAGDPKAGREHYMKYGCYACHGTSGQGGGMNGPRLAPNPLPLPAVLAELRKPRARMPIYTPKILTDAQVADIYAYLKSQPAAKSYKEIPMLNRP